MTDFTKGPWEIRENMGDETVQARHACTIGLPRATGYIILASPAPYGAEYARERAATVRLIAAAPDLYAALFEAGGYVRGVDTPASQACLERILAALAKAQGR